MDNSLDKDLVKDPQMWNLLLRVSREAVHAVVYSIVEDNSLVYRRFPIDPAATSWVGSIENVVYDNPALLSDFRNIYCIVESRDFVVIPSPCRQESQLLFSTAFPDSKLEVLTDETGTRNATVLTGIEPELRGFINRTFHRVRLSGHISSLCRYFASRSGQGNNVRMVANIRESSLDVIVTDSRQLKLANTFSFSAVADAAYYLLACRQRLGLDPHSDELLLSGDQKVREELTPILRTYISRVMPVIFPPQMFKAGKDSMLAPFDLIAAPLCE